MRQNRSSTLDAKPLRIDTENQLVWRAERIIKNRNDLIYRREVPILGRYADLVYLQGKSIFSIEFKLSNWKRALIQARDHQLAVNYAYVCFPREFVTREVSKQARSFGIGVLYFDQENKHWPFKVSIKASKSNSILSPVRDKVLDHLLRR